MAPLTSLDTAAPERRKLTIWYPWIIAWLVGTDESGMESKLRLAAIMTRKCPRSGADGIGECGGRRRT